MYIINKFMLGLTMLVAFSTFAEQAEISSEERQYIIEMQQIWGSLDRKTGEIELNNGIAKLTVPDNFYYLDSIDTEKVLVDVWGNLPGSGLDTLGMLFPAESTPFDEDSWGVTIEYEEDGYVSDEDADDIDYDDLLSQMKRDTTESSEQRMEHGYEAIELVGWAEPPYYDKLAHKLHWAKEIKFGDSETNTLNYNIRILGRKGVLVLNFIADMGQKQLIDSQLDTVLAMAEFQKDSRYEEFDPSIDKVAAYGLGALVAGKAVAKTGFLAAAFLFLKKFGIVLVAGIGAFIRKLFKSK